MTKQSMPDFVKVYFDAPTEQNNQYKCKVCHTGRKKSGTSWQNLLSHLNDKHSDWKIEVENVVKGGTFVVTTPKPQLKLRSTQPSTKRTRRPITLSRTFD